MDIDAKCTIDPDCDARAIAHSAEAGEFTCQGHMARFIAGEAAEGRTVAPAYDGALLVSLTGSKVHFPAMVDQQDTFRTRCAPQGRMGARQMRLRFTRDPKWEVTCERCQRAGQPTA